MRARRRSGELGGRLRAQGPGARRGSGISSARGTQPAPQGEQASARVYIRPPVLLRSRTALLTAFHQNPPIIQYAPLSLLQLRRQRIAAARRPHNFLFQPCRSRPAAAMTSPRPPPPRAARGCRARARGARQEGHHRGRGQGLQGLPPRVRGRDLTPLRQAPGRLAGVLGADHARHPPAHHVPLRRLRGDGLLLGQVAPVAPAAGAIP
jgi:hypothetical protein